MYLTHLQNKHVSSYRPATTAPWQFYVCLSINIGVRTDLKITWYQKTFDEVARNQPQLLRTLHLRWKARNLWLVFDNSNSSNEHILHITVRLPHIKINMCRNRFETSHFVAGANQLLRLGVDQPAFVSSPWFYLAQSWRIRIRMRGTPSISPSVWSVSLVYNRMQYYDWCTQVISYLYQTLFAHRLYIHT